MKFSRPKARRGHSSINFDQGRCGVCRFRVGRGGADQSSRAGAAPGTAERIGQGRVRRGNACAPSCAGGDGYSQTKGYSEYWGCSGRFFAGSIATSFFADPGDDGKLGTPVWWSGFRWWGCCSGPPDDRDQHGRRNKRVNGHGPQKRRCCKARNAIGSLSTRRWMPSFPWTRGIITDWNAQAVNIFGWEREEALGRRVSETVIPRATGRHMNAGCAISWRVTRRVAQSDGSR